MSEQEELKKLYDNFCQRYPVDTLMTELFKRYDATLSERDALKARVEDLERLVKEAFFEGFDDALGDSKHGYGREYYWKGSMAKEALKRGEK